MTTTIEDANELLRAAVQIRRENQAAGKPLEDWYDVSQAATEPRYIDASTEESQHVDEPYIEHLLHEHHLHRAGLTQDELDEALERLAGDGITHEQQPVTVAEQTLQGAIEAVRDRHTKYGPPNEHFGRTAGLVNAAFGTNFTPADWALVMVLDKVARLRGPTPTTDGGIDIAGYGGCYEECRSRG